LKRHTGEYIEWKFKDFSDLKTLSTLIHLNWLIDWLIEKTGEKYSSVFFISLPIFDLANYPLRSVEEVLENYFSEIEKSCSWSW
jgi:hypothetical protein